MSKELPRQKWERADGPHFLEIWTFPAGHWTFNSRTGDPPPPLRGLRRACWGTGGMECPTANKESQASHGVLEDGVME